MCGSTGAVQSGDGAGIRAPGRFDAELDAAFEQDLHADADAEHRPPAASRWPMIRSPRTARRPAMLAANAPNAGEPPAVGRQRGGAVGVTSTCARPEQARVRRVQVPGAVVQAARPLHSVPLGRNPRHPGSISRPGAGRGRRLVLGLGDVVLVAAVEHPHVQRDPGR